jgi:hypothetical protein
VLRLFLGAWVLMSVVNRVLWVVFPSDSGVLVLVVLDWVLA